MLLKSFCENCYSFLSLLKFHNLFLLFVKRYMSLEHRFTNSNISLYSVTFPSPSTNHIFQFYPSLFPIFYNLGTRAQRHPLLDTHQHVPLQNLE